MSSPLRKIQKNANNFMIENLFKTMTPEDYKRGIQTAIKTTEDRLGRIYDSELQKLQKQYNTAIQEGVMLAMDTLAVELLYELGAEMECYEKDPEFLDQKVEFVQRLYNIAMKSITEYATDKYKTNAQAQKTFEYKKKTIQKVFGIITD